MVTLNKTDVEFDGVEIPPIPSPETLREYDQISPGASDQIVKGMIGVYGEIQKSIELKRKLELLGRAKNLLFFTRFMIVLTLVIQVIAIGAIAILGFSGEGISSGGYVIVGLAVCCFLTATVAAISNSKLTSLILRSKAKGEE